MALWPRWAKNVSGLGRVKQPLRLTPSWGGEGPPLSDPGVTHVHIYINNFALACCQIERIHWNATRSPFNSSHRRCTIVWKFANERTYIEFKIDKDALATKTHTNFTFVVKIDLEVFAKKQVNLTFVTTRLISYAVREPCYLWKDCLYLNNMTNRCCI